MSEREVYGIAGAFLLIVVFTLLEMRNWLPGGRAKVVLMFLVGVSVIGSLRFARVPPIWFAGGKAAFGMVLTFAAMSFVNATPAGRSFGAPLLLGMAVTLCVLNVIVHL